MKTHLFIACNICGSKEYRIYVHKRRNANTKLTEIYSPTSIVMAFEQIVQCKKCGLIYVSPQLKQKYILRGYVDADGRDYISQEKARTQSFTRSMCTIESFKKKGKILDFGCGAGFFLKEAKAKKWQVIGIEPNKQLAYYAKKHFKISVKSKLTKQLSDDYFDVVTLWDVLEHLQNPKSILETITKKIKKNGLLIISTPNVNSLFAKIFSKYWWFYLGVHLYYFSPKTIRLLLEQLGYVIISIKPHSQILGLDYLIYRLKPYGVIYKICKMVMDMFNLNDYYIHYYAGQMEVVARKI